MSFHISVPWLNIKTSAGFKSCSPIYSIANNRSWVIIKIDDFYRIWVKPPLRRGEKALREWGIQEGNWPNDSGSTGNSGRI
jgi:hypothetical protein